ncbi:MAG: two-component system, NtrC family, nitrogen regulation sensor histidine kinase NtrY [Acidobacteriota bacterium]|jgi:nitrogen fixation/metabolism regulation signal transduction histidine kinase|nr:two-component system, NtrC family, nitrogen regulation sensor histidine kinase NtrY [Acidobacteriota bacterium]
MTLRAKIIVYLVGLHLVLGAAAAFLLVENPLLLFAVELLFVISVAMSIRLVRALFVPLDLIRTGAELIQERDFTSRFVPVGQPEMDTLIDVYNRMIERLREERLSAQEQHQLLQKIVHASPAGIVICDFDGQVESLNPAASRFLGNDVSALATIAVGESRLLSNQGGHRLKVSRAEFRDRGFVKHFYVIEEVTEALRLSEKAAYEKLIRMMSHEVNNSVGAVRSLLESSLSYAPQIGEADRDDFTSALTIASARIDALNRFMAAFADVVRIPPPQRTSTVVASLVERVMGLLRPELQQRSIALTADLADRRAFNVDESQLEQVVLNVFRNAIEAVGRDGTIAVTLRDAVLTIADSGPGITDTVRADLFTPFFTTKREGRGLGLTIVQEILANHGLPFVLENRAGGGAEFRITFL